MHSLNYQVTGKSFLQELLSRVSLVITAAFLLCAIFPCWVLTGAVWQAQLSKIRKYLLPYALMVGNSGKILYTNRHIQPIFRSKLQ